MSSSMKLLEQYLIDSCERSQRGLWVFDFDDTLVTTQSVTIVTKPDGTRVTLTPQQLTTYERQLDDHFDFRQFELLVDPREVEWMTTILRRVHGHRGPDSVAVLSARSTRQPIDEFLSMIGITGVEVIALGTTKPVAKSSWVASRIASHTLEFIEFFDDSRMNVDAVAALRFEHPNVDIVARHIDHTTADSLHNVSVVVAEQRR